MNRKLKYIFTLLMSFILLFSSINFVNADTLIENKKINIEKSEDYKKWEELSKEEKAKTIEPSFSTVNIKDSVRRSTLNSLLGNGATTIDTAFNLRTALQNRIIVKNQKKTQSCWTLSYTSVLETTMARKYNKSSLQYSPMHLEYKTTEIFNRDLNDGGQSNFALAYSASGYGPVYESDFSFDDVYSETETHYLSPVESVNLNVTPRARVTDATIFASIYKLRDENSIIYKDSNAFLGYNRYTDEQVSAIRYLIKKHIKENGAVSAVFYADSLAGMTQNGTYSSMYYNNETKAYYYKSILNPNHAVTIVGWDDNFKKENFNEGYRPIHDGAWIVLNSWGTAFGDGGYFYVSYDDASIEQSIYGISSIEEEISYDKIYEYDQLGASASLPITNDERTDYLESGYAANIFSRETVAGKNEYLSEVGIFLESTEGIEVYVNAENNNLNNTTLVATATGNNALEAGYHVIKLAEPVLLTGSKFVVGVKYINSEKNMLPLECNLYDSGFTNESNNAYSTASSNAGESFYSKDGQNWIDIEGYTYGSNTFKNTNACIKAFSTYSSIQETNSVTGVTLDKESATVTEGETTALTATIQPSNATNKNLIWTSSDNSIATVTNGIVNGVKKGDATITVTTEDGGYKDTCQITVNERTYAVTGVTLNKTTEEIYEGNSASLIPTVSPSNATNKAVTWTSSKPSVATVSNDGTITALKEGTTIITVTTVDGGYKANCTVTVKKQPLDTIAVTGVTLNKATEEIYEGNSLSLNPTVTPSNATNKTVTWTSSDTSVATVTNAGVITALKEGTTIITVTTVDGGYKANCTVTVKKQEQVKVTVTGVTLNKATEEIYEGNSTNLNSTVIPSNATNKAVTWTSSNPNVATVTNAGVITALKEGTTIVTVTTVDGGYKANCTVTVKKQEPAIVPTTGVSLNMKTSTMQVGENSNLVATITPADATNKGIKWTSSDESVAIVSDTGIITALKEGKTIITANTVDGNYTASSELTVTKKINTDDEIYEEGKKATEENKIANDNTKITGKLPQTGENNIAILAIFMVSGVALISYIKYKRNRDIK